MRLTGMRWLLALIALVAVAPRASAQVKVPPGTGRYMCQLEVEGRVHKAYPCEVIYVDWANSQQGGLWLRYPADLDAFRLEAEIEFTTEDVRIRSGSLRVPENQTLGEDYGIRVIFSPLKPVRGGWRGRLDVTSLCTDGDRCKWRMYLTIKKQAWPRGFKKKMLG